MTNSYPNLNRFLMLSFILCCSATGSMAQARLVLNGANVNLAQGAYLVIDNSASNAITRNSGHIISEGENNRVKWNIGTTSGTYTVPWGYGSADYIPLTFTKAAGIGSGHFVFSTYHTLWNNISQLPTGVTNINGASGTDNSAYVSDRFWQINAQSYTAKPTLTNLEFTYLDSENASSNTIIESGLKAKRYNSSLNSWTDNILTSTLNTTTNKVTVTSVDAANLQAWWMLGTLNSNRYWVAPSNSNSNASINWSETSGGTGNAGVPTTGDAIFFESASSNFNCFLNSDLNASSLTVSPGFLGTITQGANAITLSQDATFSGGTFAGGAGNIAVNGNFTISGTSFTAPSSMLDIKGNFNLTSGTFLNNNGTVVFSGATTQNIASASVLTFNNISATNSTASPGVSVQSNENLRGVLTLASNASFDADGSSNNAVFKLLSTGDSPTQDAAVAALPSGAQVLGNVTVQRFMTKEGPNNGRIYRYISSPIQNATVSDLQQEIPVSGSFTGRSICSGCSSTNQSLFAYNETVLADTDGNGVNNEHDGYVDFPNAANTEVFQKGLGYALFVRANLLTSTLWDLRGPINTGNVTPISFPITYTSSGTLASDGWNLVGNPFPSTIDWEAASGWTKTNIESAIYITDNGSAASIRTASWNGVTGTNGGSRYISTGQGFWIKANGSGGPVLQANENVKAAGTQTTFFREIPPSDLLRIALAKGALRDETVIHFRADATENFDGHADARKLPNSLVNVSSIVKDGKSVAINSMPSLNCSTAIQLSINDVAAGTYTFDFSEYQSFADGISIVLTDRFLNKSHDIRSGSYHFSVTSGLASYGSERFTLMFSTVKLDPTITASVTDVCEGNDVVITVENVQAGVKYDALYQGILVPALKEGENTTIRIPQNGLQPGQNTVLIRSSVEYCNATIEKEIVFDVIPLMTPVAESVVSCEAGPITLVSSGAPENASYNWYEDISAETAIEGQHAAAFETPSLKKSKTYFVSIVNALGCEGSRIPVKATIVNLEEVVITVSSTTLTSSHATGNQWYFNGNKIDGGTAQTYQPLESGVYKTEVTMFGCSTSAQTDFLIPVEVVIVPPPTVEGGVKPDPQEEEPIITPVENVSFYNIISISPNPFRQSALLEISDTFKNVTKVRIISSLGQLIGFVELTQVDGKKTGTIQLGDYPAGVYLIQIFSTTGVHERKIIKQ